MIFVILFDVFLVMMTVGIVGVYIRGRRKEKEEDEAFEKRYADHMHG